MTRLADTYSIANALVKIGLNFLQIQSKNVEWFYKTSNCRWSINPVEYQKSRPYSHPPQPPLGGIRLNSEIIIDESRTHKEPKEPIIGTQENIQQSNKEVKRICKILLPIYLIN
jgi:hypothetical protein